MADDKRTTNNQPTGNQPTNNRETNNQAMGAAAGAPYSSNETNTNSPQNPNAARGGKQEDQLSGETQKGAHNNEMRGANPQGNKPDQQSARREGDKY
jgi:hypothetical protein